MIAAAVAALALAPVAGASLRVRGNHLVAGKGHHRHAVQLRGVNRSGSEYMCADGYGVFDGPRDRASIAAIRAWKANAVRVPLNESCWLGIGGVDPKYARGNYRRAIAGYVNRLRNAGLYVILDLHVAQPPGVDATTTLGGLRPLPDATHAPDFWRSVAKRFKRRGGVVFDLYNEPHDISWKCLRDGCQVMNDPSNGSIPSYRAAGMQRLLNVVRRAGAHNVVMTSGVGYSGDLSQWLRYRPHDKAHNLAASFHNYEGPYLGSCHLDCWNDVIKPIAKRFPVVTGETGDVDCTHDYTDQYTTWADRHGVSYLAWTWDATDGGYWTCTGGPSLIVHYDGTPTSSYGAGYRTHLLAVAGHHE